MRFCDLREKEVINMQDCKNLGSVVDIGFDIENGCVTDLIIPGPGRIFGLFGRESEYVIPWHQVCKIGEDIILVDVCLEEVLVKCKE